MNNMNNLFNYLYLQKTDLEQQLSELSGSSDGLENPAVAEKVTKLEMHRAELLGRRNKLSSEVANISSAILVSSNKIEEYSIGASQRIFDAISNQRLFFITNKAKLVFDTHTGCLFPNKDIFPNLFKTYQSRRLPSAYPAELTQMSFEILNGHVVFNLPTDKNIHFYTRAISAVVESDSYTTNSLAIDSKNDKDGDITNYFSGSNRNIGYLPNEEKAIAFPFSDQFASENFFPDSKQYTQKDHAQKVLDLFIQEGWIPKFDDEEITTLYEKMYITRPALIKQLAEINQKLAELPPPKLGFADGIDLAELLQSYDLEAIRNSQVRYHAELVRWFSELLANLDEFSRDHSPLLSEAQNLIANLQDTLDEDDEPLLTERAAYLARHHDFGLESLQADLVAFKNEATTGRDALASARTLSELRQLEKQEYPDFRLVVEHSVELIKQRLQGIDWFREHKELARTLIDLHEAWRTDLHTFEHTTRTLFLEKCADESIAAEKGEKWFAEWQIERMQLEEHLLPLMRAGIERVIPVEVVISAVELLKTAIRDQLGSFFYDDRIPLHQKFAFEPGGELQEKFEKESALAAINTAFQKQLEELIFQINGTEGRLFLVRWAKAWYDSLAGELLAFVEQDHLHEQIARETLNGFRALKRHTFEAFLQDAKVYAEARDKKDKEWNSLLFRMRSDLAKKTGKGKQGKNIGCQSTEMPINAVPA